MEDTEDGFGKKRDHNQYGKEDKTPDEMDKVRELPRSPNKGTQKKGEEE